MTVLTGKNYQAEIEQAEQPVLIDFSSERCTACRALSVVIKELAAQYGDRCKFCMVDVDVQEGLTHQFDILRIPTLILMQDGEIVQRISGLRSREEILEILNLN